MERVAFSGWFKRGEKRDIFLNPFEAKRLNRNFLLSGAMQGPRHFLCFALMCLQREEGRLNTALRRARKHSSATFSWPRFTVDLWARDTQPQTQPPPPPPPSVSHSAGAFGGHLNFPPDSGGTPCYEHIDVVQVAWQLTDRRHWLQTRIPSLFCRLQSKTLEIRCCKFLMHMSNVPILNSKMTIVAVSRHVETTSSLQVRFFYCHPLKGHCFILQVWIDAFVQGFFFLIEFCGKQKCRLLQ